MINFFDISNHFKLFKHLIKVYVKQKILNIYPYIRTTLYFKALNQFISNIIKNVINSLVL